MPFFRVVLLRAALAALVVVLAVPVSAAPSLVFDAADGRVIYAEDADTPWYPASLTKLMTAYVVFDMLKRGEVTPTSELLISPHANAQPKSRLGLGSGKRINVNDALHALIIHSANDIAVALAEAVSGSEDEFVEDMNATAIKLGMLHTQFANANGLPKEGQATTARDMGLLARAIITSFPEWLPVFAKTSAEIGHHTVATHNRLLDHFEGADGMKTGFTCGAGYNIVASATRNNRKIVAVVLGERSGGERSAKAMKLLEAGFATTPGQLIDVKAVVPEPRDEASPLASLTFVPAQDLSQARSVHNCFGPLGPTAKLVTEIAERKPAEAKSKGNEKKQAKK